MGKEDFGQIHFEKSLTLGFDHVEICPAVLIIDEPVVKDPVDLMAPESYQFVGVSQVSVGD